MVGGDSIFSSILRITENALGVGNGWGMVLWQKWCEDEATQLAFGKPSGAGNVKAPPSAGGQAVPGRRGAGDG